MKRILVIIVVSVIAFAFLFLSPESDVRIPLLDITQHDIHPQVWSQYSPYGEGWEYKVNCGSNYSTLEECFLWELNAVQVHTPNGDTFDLEKDFNINSYSGEITRRWVLYGPENSALPTTGIYYFDFIRNSSVIHTDQVKYVQEKIEYPTDITWQREGNNFHIQWTPPSDVSKAIHYKVIIWNNSPTPDLFISDIFQKDVTVATLKEIPLLDEGNYSVNVAVFYYDGYAYSEYVEFVW